MQKKLEPLEGFFERLFLFAGIVLTVVVAFSFGTANLIVFSIPVIAFFLWTYVFIFGYRAKFKFQSEYELSFVETARAYCYFCCLVPATILNGFVIFFPSPLNAVLIIFLVALFLHLVEWVLPRTVFSDYLVHFDQQQKKQFSRLISSVGNVSIYYSMSVVVTDSIVVALLSQKYILNVSGLLMLLAVYVIPIYFIFSREQASRKLARTLAGSLRDTRLRNRYESKRKKILARITTTKKRKIRQK